MMTDQNFVNGSIIDEGSMCRMLGIGYFMKLISDPSCWLPVSIVTHIE